MNPDPLQPFLHKLSSVSVELALLVVVIVGPLAIAKIYFEKWVDSKLKSWKTARQEKEFAGMSDDEILDAPHCPACNQVMVLRTARKDGNRFWGCSGFPACRGLRQVAK